MNAVGVRELLIVRFRDALAAHRFTYSCERELQEAIAAACDAHGIVYLREVDGAGGRVDFTIGDDGRVGVEVKVDGGRAAVRRQLFRYASSGRFDALILVTNRLDHVHLADRTASCPVVVLTMVDPF